ncbi:MAG: hypothetical protein WAM28_08940 [Chlamydiales bacterium]
MAAEIPYVQINGFLRSTKYEPFHKGSPSDSTSFFYRMWRKDDFPHLSSKGQILSPHHFPNASNKYVEVSFQSKKGGIFARGAHWKKWPAKLNLLERVGALFVEFVKTFQRENSFSGFDAVDKETCERRLDVDLSEYDFCRYVEYSEDLLNPAAIIADRVVQGMLAGEPFHFVISFYIKEDSAEANGSLCVVSKGDNSLESYVYPAKGAEWYTPVIDKFVERLHERVYQSLLPEKGSLEDRMRECCQTIQRFIKENRLFFQQGVNEVAAEQPS